MSVEDKLIDIIQTMVEYNLLDKNRIFDKEYVLERVSIYLDAKQFISKNFKGMF